MTFSPTKSQSEFAKLMAAACVRRGYLEKLHAGFTPITRSGDYSDVKVVTPYGEIPWSKLSRLSDDDSRRAICEIS